VEDRSRRRARLVLIVGLLFAVGAGATTFFVANTAKSEAPAPIPTSSIVVAAREIPPKTQITAADLKLVKMNSEVVPPAALTRSEDIVGKITITSISVGEPILPTKLGGPNGQVFTVFPAAALGSDGAPLVNSPNYRAMSITVADAQAAGGNIQPGDTVDILYTMQIIPEKLYKQPNATVNATDASARIVLERVPVLARTLAVYVIRTDAATAERIGYLQSAGGVLQLLLRAPKDERATGTIGASFDNTQEVLHFHIPQKITP
jgi:Flp pilus assembly protein CpaB